VRRALDELHPTSVLIEGAPELDAVAALAASPAMRPPVAGLVYAVDEPRRAIFYPLAVFSPEWVALRWALEHDVPVRFADLAATHLLAPIEPAHEPDTGGRTADRDVADGEVAESDPGGPDDRSSVWAPPPDPITTLATLAGYDDPERFWEDAIEHRTPSASALDHFRALREAVAQLRADAGDGVDTGTGADESAPHNSRREAAMRRAIRAEIKAGHERLAFVCGAYHAPALHPDAHPSTRDDDALLRGLPKVKVAATWAPWTSRRLAQASGYGAGVTSPGWYQHLFVTPDDATTSWLVRVARSLRDEQLGASSASVVEAARLAEALAAVRGRPSVGLAEADDATQAVLCEGSALPLQLLASKLVIGEELGTVPAETPKVPLAEDLARQQRARRLKPSAAESVVTLDLRQEGGRARSVLLHRLRLLGIDWGVPTHAGRSTGTFKEAWRLECQPELAVAVIEASVHGTTIASAAGAKVASDAAAAPDLATLGTLVEDALLAELADGLWAVVACLERRTAQHHDTVALLTAIEPLARTARYGDVRGVDVSAVRRVLDTVALRAAVGLRAACTSLDDDAAATVRAAIESAQRGVALLDEQDLWAPWEQALAAVSVQRGVHGSVAGRCTRLLLDAGTIDLTEARGRLSRRLSLASDGPDAAAWLDGFLAGDVVLLLHDPDLLATIDGWVAGIGEEVFEDLLPLLRRTFARFSRPERRQLGEHLRRTEPGDPNHPHLANGAGDLDLDRAEAAVRKMAHLLGLTPTSVPDTPADAGPEPGEPDIA
jgi:hypothetical protein